MNSKLLVIRKTYEDPLDQVVVSILSETPYEWYEEGMSCKNRRILIIAPLNELGYDVNLLNWLTTHHDKTFFEGSIGGMIVCSTSDYYTKSMAQDLILHMNRMGLGFVGHSVLEIVKNYKNFETWQKTMNCSLEEIAITHGKQLVERLQTHQFKALNSILALHSSSYKTSNTLGLWHLVKSHLKSCEVNEIHIENGTVVDCKGCPFQTCMHFGKHHSCFYGGVMVEEVLPAIEAADIIVWVCPNYNDSVSANMLAVINRLTVLYRQISFHDKVCFAVVVSGNSGSDSVTKQLIGALNINKGFQLPPYFSIMATANDPLKVLEIQGIDDEAGFMAQNITNFCQNVK